MSKEKDIEGHGLGFIVPITVVGIIGVIACSSFTIIPTGYKVRRKLTALSWK